MKKIFTFFMACVIAVAANATDYYFAGTANNWSNNNADYKFVEVQGVLTLEVANLYGEFKITENGSWHPQHGAHTSGDKLQYNTPYTLNKCNGTSDVPNMGIEGNFTNAVLTLTENNGILTITIASADIAQPKYYMVGAFNNWKLETAVEFVDVAGVLTANIADLSGTFKIVQDKSWTNQWGANASGAGLIMGEPYLLGGTNPQNLALANPFGGYQDAVLTLAMENNAPSTLTLASGTFYSNATDNWYIPGAHLGWNCNDDTKLEPVVGQENTYSRTFSTMAGDFKIVYGSWKVEFGANVANETWQINQHYQKTYPCAGNLKAAAETEYNNVTVTIVVDYENASVDLLLSAEESTTAINTIEDGKRVQKTIQNGQLVILHNGVRYNVLGAEVR